MKKKVLLYIILLSCTGYCFGQLDSLQLLPEVILGDVKLHDFATGVHQRTLSDTVIARQQTQLTQTLRFNSLIFLRENGPGGVSSASFRGTNASQTAVVWNGININSQFTGQTDFNTITTHNYDDITIRSGGGSIPYGTGAVGGSIHLNNEGTFKDHFQTKIRLGFGSFNTPLGQIKSTYSTDRFYLDAAIDYIQSDNDFDFLDTDLTNENGDYENINWNLNLGWLAGKRHTFRLYHNTFLGDRGFARTLTAPSNTAYEDRNTRSLIQWDARYTKLESQLRLAHIFEQFRFFLSRDFEDSFSIGRAVRYTANYRGKYQFDKDKSLQAILDYTSVDGDGTSIQATVRNTFSSTLLWNHQLNNQWQYSIQLRQDETSDFDSPLLVGLGSSYAFAKAYTLKINASRNYRIPTFNDLFWAGPGARGNPDLLAETSWQGEIGHELRFKNLNIDVQTYYIRTQNLIVWLPNISGVFSPINVADTENYGAELEVDYSKNFSNHQFAVSAKYGYTIARDIEEDQRLIFVPEQKIVGALQYRYKNIGAFYQFLYNDELFTTTDNLGVLSDYAVSNLGIDYTVKQKNKQQINFSLKANNIFNRNYQVVPFRPSPGTNFLIQTTYTF